MYRLMDRQQMPFLFRFLSDSELYAFKDGQIISTFNKCGLFFCRKGNVEVSLEDKHFQINPGDVYIYMASTLVHLLHKSEDAEGVMVEVDLDYIIPIVNRVINVENQLFMRKLLVYHFRISNVLIWSICWIICGRG